MKRTLLIIASALIVLPQYGFNINSNYTPESLSINYSIENYQQVTNDEFPGTVSYNSEGFAQIRTTGKPSVLTRLETFQIPLGMKIADIQINATIDTVKAEYSPSTPTYIEGENVEITPIDKYSGVWPSQNAELAAIESYRGRKLGRLAIYPIQYNYDKKEIYLTKSLSINIIFDETTSILKSSATQTFKTKGLLSSILTIPTLEEDIEDVDIQPYALEAIFQNYGKNAPLYLIVTPDEFLTQANRFAEWKQKMGYSVVIESRQKTELQDPQNTYDLIKEYYEEGNLDYVLIFGGGNYIVPFQRNMNIYDRDNNLLDYYSDYAFACLDGEDDYLSDVVIGRMPANSLNEITTMVSKSIEYESNPPVEHNSFFKNALHFSEWDGKTTQDASIFIQTIETLKDCIENDAYGFEANINRKYYARTAEGANPLKYKNGTYIPNFLRPSNFNWNITATDITNEINKGVSYVLFRGHGAVDTWSYAGYKSSNAASLNNKGYYPIVFAITCQSGTFYHPTLRPNGKMSICEAFLANNNGGAAAAIGACRESWSGYNEYLMAGIFDAMFPGVISNFTVPGTTNITLTSNPNTIEIGSVLQIGQERMMSRTYNSIYGGINKYGRMNREIYNCLGDPALKIYRKTPIYLKPDVEVSENSIKLYHNNRNLVAYSPGTTGITYLAEKNNSYYELSNYSKYFRFALIGDGYEPIFFSVDDLINNQFDNSVKILSVEKEENGYIVNYSGDTDNIAVSLYDIYGNKVDTTLGEQGTARLNGNKTISIVVLYKDGILQDTRRVLP